jgi:ATP-dependent helicase/nuclease subunit B
MAAGEFGGEVGMDLIFGLACDGRAYPDFPGAGAGVVDAAVVETTGRVDILLVQLGLSGPSTAKSNCAGR